MTTNIFKKKLKQIIEKDNTFITDAIPMEGINTPMDAVIYIAGGDENAVFLLHIQKII